MGEYGGEKVYSFLKIFDKFDGIINIPIIHVGGETLPVSLKVCLHMDFPNINFKQDVQAMIINIMSDNYDRSFGYITPPTEKINGLQKVLPIRIFYGIGYTNKSSKPTKLHLSSSIYRDLKEACFLGLRDGDSVDNAISDGPEMAEFTPDCVLLISELWNKQRPQFLPDG